MDELSNLQSRVNASLTQPSIQPAAQPVARTLVATTGGAAVEEVAAPPRQRFTPFDPIQMARVSKLVGHFIATANSNAGPTGLNMVFDEFDKATATENPELVKYALLIFMTHYPQASRLTIPSLEVRAPGKLLPSIAETPATLSSVTNTTSTTPQTSATLSFVTDSAAIEAHTLQAPPAKPATPRATAVQMSAQANQQETQLAWYREDPKANEHHEHWHIVYPHSGIISDPQSPAVLKDRQDELFLYMHEQMLARYDTERIALNLPRVKSLEDYKASILEGYDPGPLTDASGNKYFRRPPGLKLRDVPGYSTVNDLATRRDRLRDAVDHGFQQGNTRVPVDANVLGATVEASIGSFSAPGDGSEPAPSSFYGNQHNMGHVLLGYITDPVNQNQAGAILDVATAIRDPVFYRWHKHIDDFSFRWQEKQHTNDFSDAPQVLIRKKLNKATPDNHSPDIILGFKDNGAGHDHVIPGSGDPSFDGQAFGEQTFGGTNWGTDFSNSAITTNELHTRMFQRTITWGPNSENTIPIHYLDQDKEFFYFIRVENQLVTAKDVTVRIFLVAQAVANDRRMWIEMDKFSHTLQPSERAVIFRQAESSSVIKKPAVRPPGSFEQPASTGDPTHDDAQNYCNCGWPYNLLLPRGTHAGMNFRLLVMITDGDKDHVADDSSCGSMSYCGAKDKYPDTRSMGYPFDRPFPQNKPIAQTIAAHNNMATRDITIKWLS